MATVDIGALTQVYRVTFKMLIRNQQIQTGFNLVDVGIPNESAQSCLENVRDFYLAKMRPALSNEIFLQRIEVERWLEGSFFAQDFVGQNGSLNLPMQSTYSCLAIAVRSNQRKRIANGRFFWPCAGSWANDTVGGAQLAAATQMVADLTDQYLGNPLFDRFRIGTVHRPVKDKVTGLPIGVHKWTEATALRLNPVVSALRTRKVGVGN